MSPRNFARAFRDETGRTPAAYVTDLRVERSRQLLEDGAEPIDVDRPQLRLRNARDHAPRLRAAGRGPPGRIPVPLRRAPQTAALTRRRRHASRLPALRPLHRPRHHRAARGAEQRPRRPRRSSSPRRPGRSATSPTRCRWSPTPRSTRSRARTSSSSPAASGRAPCSSTSRCSTGSASAHETSTWTTSVCTGSLLLAAAGLLDGAPATTHWTRRELLGELGAKPVPDRVVAQGKIITAAGVSSGIDMALHAGHRDLRGPRSPRPCSSASSTTPSRRSTPARPRRRRRRSSTWSAAVSEAQEAEHV